MKIKYTLLMIIVLSTFAFCQTEEASFAPQARTFATDPDLLGVLSNSVNLFTGQVNLPLNLITLPGRGGLDVNVSILYNSNVDKIVDTWNLEAPTGVLGLGWSLNIPQIVANNKQTGTREDDEYYLVENGTSNKLICTEINQNVKTFEAKNYNPWLISYDTSDEKWTITKEDGTKYIYGDENSGRQTVQYIVRWGNWIGNTSQSGGEQQAFIWNLSEIVNEWNEKISFEYLNAYRSVVNNTAEYTEASYLRKITDIFGRVIEFYYPNKDDSEFQDPHTETFEPDAYQERYEKKRLDSLHITDRNSVLLSAIYFNSILKNHNGIYKRYLTSIYQKNYSGEETLPLKFEYSESSINYGALIEVETPSGGKVIYTYGSHQIEYSELNSVAQAPNGMAEPRVFIHENYVVITWRSIVGGHSEDYKQVNVQIWEWDGKWIKALEQPIGDVKLIDNYQDFSITLQDDFFAVLTATHEKNDARQARLYTFTKDYTKKGHWIGSDATVMSNNTISCQLVSGNNFIGVKFSQQEGTEYIYDYMSILNKNGLNWVTDIDKTPLGAVGIFSPSFIFIHRNFISANNNFLLLFSNSFDSDIVKIYYYSGNNELNITPNLSLGINTGSSELSYLYSNFFSLLLFGYNTAEYIYDWDENYSNLIQRSVIGPYPDYSSPYPTIKGYGIMKGDMWRSFFARRTGTNWIQSNEGEHKQFNVAFGDDFFVYGQQGSSNHNVTLRKFNANTSSFEDMNINLNYHHAVKSGRDLFTCNELIFNRKTSGQWEQNDSTLYVPPGGIYNTTIRHGLNFTAYNSHTGSTINTYVIPHRNGNPLAYSELSGRKIWHYTESQDWPKDKSELVGSNIIVAFSSSYADSDFRNVTALYLYKVINDKPTGKLTRPFVKGFEIYDGENANSTAIHYYPQKGIVDPSGTITQYHKVRVIPGGSLSNYNPNVHPSGYTDTYFFNGLTNNEVELQWPSNTENVTNASDYYKVLTGNIFESRVFDKDNNLKSSSKNYWYVHIKNINNEIGYYYRLMKKEDMLDGVTTITENLYNNYGLLTETKTDNHNSAGLQEILKKQFKYAYEAYTEMLTKNMLTPVIQTKSWNNTTCTGISSVTMKEWSPGKWAPHKSYVNKDYETNDFNFESWSGSNEPSGTIWMKTGEIILINSIGEVLETMDAEGKRSTKTYDLNGIPIASLSNTSNTQYLADNFDDLDITYFSPLPWILEGNWQITSNGVLKYNGLEVSSSARPYINTTQVQSNFIAEFDVRVPESFNTLDWGGFQFRKTAATHSSFESGYTVFLRKNGSVDLYKPEILLGSYQIPGSSADWHRITVAVDGSNIKIIVDGIKGIEVTDNTFNGSFVGFFSHRAKAEFDNLIIHPMETFATLTAYDPFLGTVKAMYSTGKEKVRFAYDSFQRRIGEIGSNGIPLSTTSTSLSLDRNASYQSSDPNVSLQTTINGEEGYYEDFETHLNDWNEVNGSPSNSTWILENGKLKHNNSGNGNSSTADLFYLDLGYELKGRVGMEFSVKTSGSANNINFGFAAGDGSWNISGSSKEGSTMWTYFYGYSAWRYFYLEDENIATYFKPDRTYRLKIILDMTTQTMDFYIDGKPQMNNKPFRKTTTGIQKISFFNYGAGNTTEWVIDDLMLYTEPSHSVVYSDGIGRVLQSQIEEDNSKILVTETLYDELGRGHISTKSTLIDSWFEFKTNFITGINLTTGVMTGDVATINNDSYPYSRTVFEPSPLSRVVESSLPGIDFKIGGGHTSKTDNYAYNYGLLPGNLPTAKYLVTKTTNADGIISYIVKDKLGNMIGSKSGPVKGNAVSSNSVGIDESNLTNSFSVTFAQEAAYSFEKYNTHFIFQVGTYPGGSDVLVVLNSGSGSFTVNVGVQYYLTLNGDPKEKGNPGESAAAEPIANAVVAYKTLTFDEDIYPTVIYKNEVTTSGSLARIFPPNYFNPPYENVDPADFIIESRTNILGQLVYRKSSDAGEEKYIYDKAGRLRFTMDANGAAQNPDNILYFKYDNLGRVVEKGYYAYNWNETNLQDLANSSPNWPAGVLTWRKKYYYGNLGNNSFEYGKLVRVEVNNNSDINSEVLESYTYNYRGEIVNVNLEMPYDGINRDISYTFNNVGQTETIQYLPQSITISNVTITSNQSYDATSSILVGPAVTIQSGGNLILQAGNEIRLLPGFTASSGSQLSASIGSVGGSGAEGVKIVYKYDRIGRVKEIGTDLDSDLFASYTYNVNGDLHQEKLNNNSLTREFNYNSSGWLTQIDDQLFKEEISYTTGGYGGGGYYNGNISKLIFTDKAGSTSHNVMFKYDNLGKLLTADNSIYNNYDLGVGTGNEIKYDANGNLVSVKEGSTTKSYKYYTGKNRVKNTNGSGSSDYNYDFNGNVTGVTSKQSTLTYDPYFNLTNQVTVSSSTSSFIYGGNNERIAKGIGGDKVFYFRGLSDYPLMEKSYAGDALNNTVLYVYGPTGLIAVNDNNEWNFIIKDHLGSTRVVFRGNNQVAAKYHYSPFGRMMYAWVNTDVAYKFTGQEFDDELGLHNFRARMYDAELGMFYAYDPAMQGFSPFGYCGNNPVMYIDKDGRLAWFVVPVIVGVVAGAINVATHWDQIQEAGFWEGAKAFGIGFGAGFVGTVSGTSAFLAAGGGAAGAGGFIAGATAGFVGSATSMPIQSYLNSTAFGDEPLTWQNYAWTVGVSTLTGGIFNGASALANGRNFWNGNLLSTSISDATSVATNTLHNGLSDSDIARGYKDANGTIDDLYHYTSKTNATSISNEGLNLSKDGFVYTTPKGDLTPIQAQIELSLKPNYGLPDALFKIDIQGLNRIGINPILGPRQVFGGVFGAGGGKEILFNQKIPWQYLYRIK